MNTPMNKLLRVGQRCSILLFTILLTASAQVQRSAAPAGNDNGSEIEGTPALTSRFKLTSPRGGFRLMPATISRTNTSPASMPSFMKPMAGGSNVQVIGSGTVGRLAKWTAILSTNSVVGDSTIFEDKWGKVGIGTDSPTSKLTIAGMIETTLGGLKFPDGSVQTTAAVSGLQSVFHNATLQGAGTSGSPLDVAVPLNLTGQLPGFDKNILTVVNSGDGGSAINAVGGDGGFAGLGNGSGGRGVIAAGGDGRGAGKSGGDGIFARGGAGTDGATTGRAGAFLGLVAINGDLNVTGTKNFKIDHPLDPENKYLYHAAIESSEVLNIYSGNVTINEIGEAIVTLPDWFEALNKDFRYQLTSIGAPAQGLYIAEKVNKNHFRIAGGQPGMEVSWQVTGVRSDAAMRQYPFKAEQDKPERERGTYLTPEAFGQSDDKGGEWARKPETMQQMKESREKQLEQLRSRGRIN